MGDLTYRGAGDTKHIGVPSHKCHTFGIYSAIHLKQKKAYKQ